MNGKAFKQALKSIGANNVFTQLDKSHKKVKGLNYWIAEGVMTFEGAYSKIANMQIGDPQGKDYQVCGFLDKTSIMLIRNFASNTKVDVSLIEEKLVFSETLERVVIHSRFKMYEPAASSISYIMEIKS